MIDVDESIIRAGNTFENDTEDLRDIRYEIHMYDTSGNVNDGRGTNNPLFRFGFKTGVNDITSNNSCVYFEAFNPQQNKMIEIFNSFKNYDSSYNIINTIYEHINTINNDINNISNNVTKIQNVSIITSWFSGVNFYTKWNNGLLIQGGTARYTDTNHPTLITVTLFQQYQSDAYSMFLTDCGGSDNDVSTHKVISTRAVDGESHPPSANAFCVKRNSGSGTDPFKWLTIGRWK